MAYNFISCSNEADLLLYQKSFIKNDLPKELEPLKWLHLSNPLGEMYVDFAIEDNNPEEVAAIYAVFPVQFSVMQDSVKATQSIDTLTDINHRGKGLFNNLAQSVFKKSSEKGCSFVYGFPNDQSAHGFFKKLGWVNLGEAPFIFKPLRAKYFLNTKIKSAYLQELIPDFKLSFVKERKQYGNSIEIKTIEKFSNEYNNLWDSFSFGKLVAVKRDAAYLNWRFIEKPFENYVCKALYENSVLQGFVVFCIKEKHNGKIGYIMELIYSPNNFSAGKLLLEHAVGCLNSLNADLLLAWNLKHSQNSQAYKALKFFSLPSKLRPIKLFFGVRSFNSELDNNLYNNTNWYLSYADSDTV
jgi:hypothetical protein